MKLRASLLIYFVLPTHWSSSVLLHSSNPYVFLLSVKIRSSSIVKFVSPLHWSIWCALLIGHALCFLLDNFARSPHWSSSVPPHWSTSYVSLIGQKLRASSLVNFVRLPHWVKASRLPIGQFREPVLLIGQAPCLLIGHFRASSSLVNFVHLSRVLVVTPILPFHTSHRSRDTALSVLAHPWQNMCTSAKKK